MKIFVWLVTMIALVLMGFLLWGMLLRDQSIPWTTRIKYLILAPYIIPGICKKYYPDVKVQTQARIDEYFK